MTSNEYRRRLDQLFQVITRGLTHYAVWKKLRLRDPESVEWSLEQQNQILGRFRGFLTPVAIALLDMTLIEFAKVFDADTKTASLRNLLRSARRNPTLVPHASTEDLRRISSELKQYSGLLTNLNRKRSQELVHVDALPEPVDPILTADFDKLAMWVRSAFNTLSTGHDQSFFSWEHSLNTSEGQTTEVLGILLKDIGARQQEYEETTVRIGLDVAQDFEKTMGHRPDSEEIRSVTQSYGLTQGQMQRVEAEYRARNQGVQT